MKRVKWIWIGLLAIVTLSVAAQDQKPAFWNEVQAFRKQDSLTPPPKNRIVFAGSSSFTLWKDVQDYFPDRPILNRAFGGSTLLDVIRYREDVILKYQPKQVVIYCGENDFASSDTITVGTVVGRFKQLFSYIRARYPKVPVMYVSMKPSPSRLHLLNKFESANKLIQLFLRQQRNTVFVDVYHPMLKKDGKPLDGIFKEDNLHMNAKGYAIWKKLIGPYLVK